MNIATIIVGRDPTAVRPVQFVVPAWLALPAQLVVTDIPDA
ncbi:MULTISPECIES: hypothetical protein [Paenibacillus]|nr:MULTISPECIES: hypothetical protein [Paenibacillus]